MSSCRGSKAQTVNFAPSKLFGAQAAGGTRHVETDRVAAIARESAEPGRFGCVSLPRSSLSRFAGSASIAADRADRHAGLPRGGASRSPVGRRRVRWRPVDFLTSTQASGDGEWTLRFGPPRGGRPANPAEMCIIAPRGGASGAARAPGDASKSSHERWGSYVYVVCERKRWSSCANPATPSDVVVARLGLTGILRLG